MVAARWKLVWSIVEATMAEVKGAKEEVKKRVSRKGAEVQRRKGRRVVEKIELNFLSFFL